MTEGSQRRLAAIVSVDVVGYSRLMGVDETGTLAALREHRAELIGPSIAQHGGRTVKTMGDGLLLEFPSVVNATKCAVEIQRGMRVRNEGIAEDQRIILRVGVNVGDIIIDGDDILGDGVNVAARLEGLAEPGGVCLSAAARDQIRDKLHLALDDLGDVEVKNIARPMRAFRVVLDDKATARSRPVVSVSLAAKQSGLSLAAAVAVLVLVAAGGYLAWFQPWAADVNPSAEAHTTLVLPDKPSIAVLPFDNLSGDSSQDYFVDGMVDDLITDLSKVKGLFVIARNSSFTYKGKAVKVQQVAEDLGVRFVVEGSLRPGRDVIHINVQLIDATKGHHVWADRYDIPPKETSSLLAKIVQQIAAALDVEQPPGQNANLRSQPETKNPKAHEAVLRGWDFARRTTAVSYAAAKQEFERAIKIDPDYARAHTSLAAIYWWGARNGWHYKLGAGFNLAFKRAAEHLSKGLQDPSPLAYQLASEIELWKGEHKRAIETAKQAIALDANDPAGRVALSLALANSGELDAALNEIKLALRKNPEQAVAYQRHLGFIQYLQGEYVTAVDSLTQATAFEPNDDWPYRWLIASYGHLGKQRAAAKAIQDVNQIREKIKRSQLTMFEIEATSLKREKDKERLREGWRKAGVPEGRGIFAHELVLNRIVFKRNDFGFDIKGATKIDVVLAKALYDQGALFVDVRKSYSAGHVKGARQLVDPTAEKLAAIAKKERPVIFYCSGFT